MIWTFIVVTKEKGKQKQVWTKDGVIVKRLPRKLKKKITKSFIYKNRPDTYSFGFWVKGLAYPTLVFTSRMKTVMIFNRSITEKEVRQLYRSGKGVHYAELKENINLGLTDWWDFGEVEDGTRIDNVEDLQKHN
jgi:hypothetical protein